jgi:hypothetical protein
MPQLQDFDPRLPARTVLEPYADTQRPAAAPSPLAALLDRFTESLANPDTTTVGDFATSVQALHGEFALLARQFRHDTPLDAEPIDFDDIFPDLGDIQATGVAPISPVLDPAYHGIAAAEELEHLCQTLSR